MNNKILKSMLMVITIISVVMILTTTSNAANLSISTSKSSVSPGEVFSVTVTLEGGAGPISASVSNGSGSGSQWLENSSLTFNCTAGSSGTITISASGTVGDFTTEEDVKVSQSKNVSIVVPETTKPSNNTTTSNSTGSSSSGSSPVKNNTTTKVEKKSNNSKLSSLEILEGVLTPEFNSGVTEYEISVPNEITKLSITAVPDDSKATVKITGNEELQVGENTIELTVTAEDGSKTTYKILAKRAEPELNLQTLTVAYIDENQERVELELNPLFSFEIYDYIIDFKLPYTVKNLEILGTANRENAVIEILENEELKSGENIITIKVTVADETGLEEQKIYTIKVVKEEEPIIAPITTVDKIKNFFSGTGTTISKWITKNFEKIIIGMLIVATVAFTGLTIYFVYDYKNYQKLLAKLAELNKTNLIERANVALEQENINPEEKDNSKDFVENILKENQTQKNNKKEIVKTGKGKRFK